MNDDFEGNPMLEYDGQRHPKVAFLSSTEFAPDTMLYRKPKSRPKMSQIRKLSSLEPDQLTEARLSISDNVKKSKNTVGWFLGVFVPTLVNLLCFTFFIEVPVTIKKVGLGYGLVFLAVFELIAYGTLSSICAIATNGEMKDGGVYYLISRTLGREYGAAIGIVLIISHCTAVSSRIFYLCHMLTDLYSPKTFTSSLKGDESALKVIFCACLFVFGLLGTKVMLYFLVLILLVVITGVICFNIGIFEKKRDDILVGFSYKIFHKNWFNPNMIFPSFKQIGDLLSSTNGIMTVADFGGNLNPPQKSIPIGGFSALVVSSVLFIFASFFIAFCVDFEKVSENNLSLSLVSISPVTSSVGFITACFGSALTMGLGGTRIIMMMAKDKLIPQFLAALNFNNLSIVSMSIVILTSLAFSFIPDPIIILAITNISFLFTLALANITVYSCASAHYPGFRPTFRLFNKWSALFLGILCCVRAFFINWFIAIIFAVVFIACFCIYRFIIPAHDEWGSVLSSETFYSTMDKALKLYTIESNVKTYRSHIIYITTDVISDKEPNPTIDLLNQMLNRHGMLCVGRIIISNDPPKIKNLIRDRESIFLKDNDGYRVFYDVIVAPTIKEGIKDMLLQVGIGKMRPNTLCLEFPEDWQNGDYKGIVDSIYNAYDAKYAVSFLRNVGSMEPIIEGSTIDVWCTLYDGGISLLLPYLLSKQKQWKNARLRIMTIAFVDENDVVENTQKTMEHLLYKFRIKAEVVTIELSLRDRSPSQYVYDKWRNIVHTSSDEGDIDTMTLRYLVMSDLVREHSISASLIVFTMMLPHDVNNQYTYMAWLDVLSSVRVPFLLIRGNGESTMSLSL